MLAARCAPTQQPENRRKNGVITAAPHRRTAVSSAPILPSRPRHNLLARRTLIAPALRCGKPSRRAVPPQSSVARASKCTKRGARIAKTTTQAVGVHRPRRSSRPHVMIRAEDPALHRDTQLNRMAYLSVGRGCAEVRRAYHFRVHHEGLQFLRRRFAGVHVQRSPGHLGARMPGITHDDC